MATRSRCPARSAASRIVSIARSVDSRSGAKPPSSPTPVARPSSWRTAFSAWKTSAPMRSASENDRPGGHHHELLEIEPILRVHSAVDHVQHRHRKRVRGGAAEPPVQRLACLGRRCFRRGERAAQDRVGASLLFVGVPSSSIRTPSSARWSSASSPASASAISPFTCRPPRALPCRGTPPDRRRAALPLRVRPWTRRRDDRAPEGAGQGHVDLDRGLPRESSS